MSLLRTGGDWKRFTGRDGGVEVRICVLGLLAELTFSKSAPGSNKSTAAKPFLRGWRVFDCVILVVLDFLGLIADLGSDKNSCAFNSSGERAGELALLRLGCGGKVEGSGDRISGLPFGGWGGRRLWLPD
ncbi:MAG: hypothetical protein LH628_10380 [Microcoleus sp. CAN_BIN18]|nr:hypothetical protein [Microcoleus sp. CAN_BIN18]